MTFQKTNAILTKSVREKRQNIWDHSSAGRASALQAEGHRFEPYWSHTFSKIGCGGIAQLARAHGSYPWCRRFKSYSRYLHGILAQLGEHLPYKQRVTGSSPVGPIYAGVAELADAQDLKSCGTYTPVSVRFRSPAYLKNFVGIAQLDRAFGYGPKGRGFESSCPRLILLES